MPQNEIKRDLINNVSSSESDSESVADSAELINDDDMPKLTSSRRTFEETTTKASHTTQRKLICKVALSRNLI